jgi:hypothetical protein
MNPSENEEHKHPHEEWWEELKKIMSGRFLPQQIEALIAKEIETERARTIEEVLTYIPDQQGNMSLQGLRKIIRSLHPSSGDNINQ